MTLESLRAAKSLLELDLNFVASDVAFLRQSDSSTACANIEEYVSLLSSKMDVGDSSGHLSACTSLLLELFHLIDDYADNNDLRQETRKGTICVSHRIYEYVLYILLGLAENADTLRTIVNAVENMGNANIEALFRSIGSTIPVDSYYFTQVSSYKCWNCVEGLSLFLRRKWLLKCWEGYVFHCSPSREKIAFKFCCPGFLPSSKFN